MHKINLPLRLSLLEFLPRARCFLRTTSLSPPMKVGPQRLFSFKWRLGLMLQAFVFLWFSDSTSILSTHAKSIDHCILFASCKWTHLLYTEKRKRKVLIIVNWSVLHFFYSRGRWPHYKIHFKTCFCYLKIIEDINLRGSWKIVVKSILFFQVLFFALFSTQVLI